MFSKKDEKKTEQEKDLTKEIQEFHDEEVRELNEVIDAKGKEIAELTEKVEQLEIQLKSKGTLLDASKGSAIITDPKKLDPKKSYVSGPSGIGFVEAK